MSSLGLMANISIDDFDPLISYSNYSEWTTPDPSVNPTWYNASRDVTNSPWHEATFHTTTTPGAKALFNFTGSSLYIYGATGPTADNANYTIVIDPSSAQPYTQTFTGKNGTNNERILLYGTDNLRWDWHNVEVTNKGSGLTLDLVLVGGIMGAEGTTTRNVTVEDAGGAVRYAGSWTTQSGPNFSNGTSTYTSGGANSFAFDFEGSAVYLYGDQVNDHGFFEVYVDQGDTPWNSGGKPNATLNDRSGCGGGWAKACEKLKGLKYSTSGLGQGKHTLAVRNLGYGSYPGDPTFFDFDYALVTVPQQYANVQRQAGSCPFTTCSGSATGSASASATASAGRSGSASLTSTSGGASASAATSSKAAGGRTIETLSGAALGWGLVGAWILRRVLA